MNTSHKFAARRTLCAHQAPSCHSRKAQRHHQRVCAFFDFLKPKASAPLKKTDAQELLEVTSTTNLGLNVTPEAKEKISELVSKLAAAGAGKITTDKKLSGTWRMVYTTEKETLFIVKNAGFFGTTAGDVFQVIDVENNSLQNVITFPPEGAFLVNSSIKIAGDQRVEFKFTNAQIKLPNRVINLPPFGQGWFDTVYLDDNLRVAQDVRGDTLIVQRDGGPRTFAFPEVSN